VPEIFGKTASKNLRLASCRQLEIEADGYAHVGTEIIPALMDVKMPLTHRDMEKWEHHGFWEKNSLVNGKRHLDKRK
jgi:hypothetical protein